MTTPPTFVTGQVLTASQMNTIGAHLITTRTVSSATEMIFDNVFTSDYLSYFCIVTISSATATGFLHWQERVSGVSANSSYSYAGVGVYLSAGSGFQNTLAGQNLAQGAVGSFDGASGSQGHIIFDISAPQTSAYTAVTGRFSMATGNTGMYTGHMGSQHYVSTVYDGMRLFVTSGNFTAVGRLYGYRNS